jgi:hypothetical protein
VMTLTLEVHGRDKIGCRRQAFEGGDRSSRVLLFAGIPLKKRITESVR